MTEFKGIVAELGHYANRQAGIAEVEVESVVPLDETQRRELQSAMEKKLSHRVSLVERLRVELLGGLILRHDDRQWNASLLHRLHRMMRAAGELKGSHGAWSE
jgi:F0F1-type ATP synthase delta subunit